MGGPRRCDAFTRSRPRMMSRQVLRRSPSRRGACTPCAAQAREEAEQAREDYAFALEAQHDELQEDPLLIALGNAREAADREIRHLLAYGREFHGDRPYKLESLAQASGMTPSGIRTA